MVSLIANPSIKDEKLNTHSLCVKSLEIPTITPEININNTTKICPISNPTLKLKRLQTTCWLLEIMNRIAFAYPKPCMSPNNKAIVYWTLSVFFSDEWFLKFIKQENTMVHGMANSTQLSFTRIKSVPLKNSVNACPMVNAVTNTSTCFHCLNWNTTDKVVIK